MKKLKRRVVIDEEFNRGTWFTIDPGVNIGIARWVAGKLEGVRTEVIKSREPTVIAYEIQNILLFGATGILIESVELRTGSSVSMAAGARGDLFVLEDIVAMFIYSYRNYDIRKVPPSAWKGQLSDDQLRYVLKKKFNYTAKNCHEACAVGIGYYAKGLL
jgi:hypothetical protein